MSGNKAKDVKIMSAGDAIAAASNTNSLGTAINTEGFDGVMFVVPIADSVATGVATISAEQCDTVGGSYAALNDDVATVTCGTNDDINNKFLVVDVFKPREQFVKLRRASTVANIAFGNAVAILYGARSKPTALGDVAALAKPISPAET